MNIYGMNYLCSVPVKGNCSVKYFNADSETSRSLYPLM